MNHPNMSPITFSRPLERVTRAIIVGASSGIGDFRFILKWNELNSPLKRNVNQEDVGNAALYLLSDLGGAVTGEIQHVDCGYHTVGMVAVDETENISNLLSEFKKDQ